MSSKCSICKELLIANQEIEVTLCGHSCHRNCLSQWLARTTTCPQCSGITTLDSVHPLHPISNANPQVQDTHNLERNLESLQEIWLRNKQTLVVLKAENTRLRKEAKGLAREALALRKSLKLARRKHGYYTVQMKLEKRLP